MDDTLTVKHCTVPEARSVKDAFVLNHQYMHRYYTHLLYQLWDFCAHLEVDSNNHLLPTHTLRSVSLVPLSLKVSPGSLLTTGYKMELRDFNVFPCLVRAPTSLWPSIDLNQYGPISSHTPVLGLLMSVQQRTGGLRDELQLSLGRSIPFEVIGLMRSPEP